MRGFNRIRDFTAKKEAGFIKILAREWYWEKNGTRDRDDRSLGSGGFAVI